MSKSPTLSELLEQRAALDKQIAEMQREQRADAIARVKSMMAEHGVTLADIGAAGRPPAAPRAASAGSGGSGKVAPKYRDPATGATWSGRGLKPKWLAAALAAGRSLSDFAI